MVLVVLEKVQEATFLSFLVELDLCLRLELSSRAASRQPQLRLKLSSQAASKQPRSVILFMSKSHLLVL